MLQNNQKEIILLKDLGLEYPTEKSTKKARFGLFRCFCGNEFKTILRHIKTGNTKSCGCLNPKHGLINHRLYKAWANIIQRCNNSKTLNYKDYGERGITICNEWKNDFIAFYNWSLENGYSENLTIDRINHLGNYEPNNCRWTDKKTQSRNTRKIHKHNTSGYRGVCWKSKNKKWQTQITVNSKKIHLGLFNIALDGALAYDNYIIKHNLEHTKNF